MKRLLINSISAALVLLIAVLLFRAYRPPTRYNILLITLDTTRADRLGCYGYDKADTPTLDRLAANGALFERAYSSVPITLPSHTTIMTGLHPPEHGLRLNDSGALPGEITTLAEVLGGSGYRTAAFVASSVLDAKVGLDQGFEVYSKSSQPNDPNSDCDCSYRPGDIVTDEALAWLNYAAPETFFCWVHLYDPHYPYHYHKDIFGDKYTKRAYDAEIAFADIQVGKLLDLLRSRNILDISLFDGVGDHRETVSGPHAEPPPHHGYMLYCDTMRVPMIFHLPPRIAAGSTIRQQVGLVDVFPALLAFLNVEPPQQTSGRSFWPLIEGAALPPRACYGETDFPAAYGWSPQRSITTENWKYVRSSRPELYDLQADPHETNNLAAARPRLVDELDIDLDSLQAQMRKSKALALTLTDEDRRRLESLGYVAGGRAPSDVEPSSDLKDIKDMLTTLAMSLKARRVSRAGDHEGALPLWQQVVTDSPQTASFRNGLALCLLEHERPQDAVEQLRTAMRLLEDEAAKVTSGSISAPGALYPRVLNNLAWSLTNLNRHDEALPLAKEAARLLPQHGSVMHTLGTVHRGLGNYEEALRAARLAVELAPDQADHRSLLEDLLKERTEQE
jgi:arylsulfatase A-like enzyme/Flp pilus assembly protein TadD